MWNCFHQNFLLNIILKSDDRENQRESYVCLLWPLKSTSRVEIYIALSALASSLYNLNTHIFLPVIEPIKHKLFFRDFYTLMSADANIKGSKPEILRLLWDIVVLRLVAYLLNMICLILQLSYKIASIWILVKIWYSFI